MPFTNSSGFSNVLNLISTDQDKLNRDISFLNQLDNQLRQAKTTNNQIGLLNTLYDMVYSNQNHIAEVTDHLSALKNTLTSLQTENESLRQQVVEANRVATENEALARAANRHDTTPVVTTTTPPIINVSTTPVPPPAAPTSNTGSMILGLGLVAAMGYGAYWYYNNPGVGYGRLPGSRVRENPLPTIEIGDEISRTKLEKLGKTSVANAGRGWIHLGKDMFYVQLNENTGKFIVRDLKRG